VGLFRRDLDYFLKVLCYLKLCSASSDVSFILHSMEEEDGMGSDTYCTPNAQESICQGVLVLVMARQEVLVLAMRPSCGDGHGMTYLL